MFIRTNELWWMALLSSINTLNSSKKFPFVKRRNSMWIENECFGWSIVDYCEWCLFFIVWLRQTPSIVTHQPKHSRRDAIAFKLEFIKMLDVRRMFTYLFIRALSTFSSKQNWANTESRQIHGCWMNYN